MNVLSLFDGKSSGYTALELAGKEITNYYSSEVDKYAIKVSEAIHPNQKRLGDVTKWREWDIDWDSIDLVIAGSPCQGFSFAGKQLAFDDPRSKLFFVFVDILNHVKALNPDVKFLLENVKMKKEFMQVIDEQLGVESILINSALVSAQNRQRLYWSNIPIDEPVDRGVVLNDILSPYVHEKFYVSDRQLSRLDIGNLYAHGGARVCFQRPGQNVEKSECLQARDYKGISGRQFFTVAMTNGRLRKLTPREYFRLQTVPEHYIDKALNCGVSNTQLIKIAGNGWTDEVIAHIFRGL